MSKDYIKFRGEWLEAIEQLTSERDKGELALAIVRYMMNGEEYKGNSPAIKAILPALMTAECVLSAFGK